MKLKDPHFKLINAPTKFFAAPGIITKPREKSWLLISVRELTFYIYCCSHMLVTSFSSRRAAAALRKSTHFQNARYLGCTPRKAKRKDSQNGRTTHFGFETIAESAKQDRGKSAVSPTSASTHANVVQLVQCFLLSPHPTIP